MQVPALVPLFPRRFLLLASAAILFVMMPNSTGAEQACDVDPLCSICKTFCAGEYAVCMGTPGTTENFCAGVLDGCLQGCEA